MIQKSTEEIIKKYSDTVYKLAYAQMRNKSDADDIYQEVFIRFIRKKPRFESEEHAKAWFIRVTVNCCKKYWASSWFKRNIITNDLPEETTSELIELSLELDKLPEKYRYVIHLFYYEDMSIEKISKVLNRKPSTVRTQLTRGRRLLKDILEEASNA